MDSKVSASEGTAERYAREVTVSREAFAQTFDAVAAGSALNGYLDFKMTALGAADDRSAFAAAFARAATAGFLGRLVASLTELRYLNFTAVVTTAGAPIEAAELGLTPQDATAGVFSPQGITADMIQMLDAATMVRGLLEATRRVCMIEIDGTGRGTGFLVGPQTVLTNWHVIHSLLDPATGQALPGSARRLACSFDLVGTYPKASHAAADTWLIEWSPMAVPPTPGPYPDMTALKAGTLDFCVIRVTGAPGRLRGWYDLSSAVAVRAPDTGAGAEPFFVVQHPQADMQRVAVAGGVTPQPGKPQFIAHKAPTLAGSSGGLCLDARFNLVALHQGEFRKQGALSTNVAIAAPAIAELAPAAADVQPEYDVVWKLHTGKAVIGRANTLSKITAMSAAAAPKPFLLVRGSPQSGKSFTGKLIEHRVEYRNRVLVKLAGNSLPATGRELAQAILSRAGSIATDDLPSPVGSGTTPVAWYKGQFMVAFSSRLREALAHDGGTKLVWVVVDRLTEEDATPSDAMNFLHALYEAALPEMRFVLIGLNGGLPAGDPAKAELEDLPDPRRPSKQDVRTYLQCLFADLRIAAQTGEIDRLADLVLDMAEKMDVKEDPALPNADEADEELSLPPTMAGAKKELPLLPKIAKVLTIIFNPMWEQWRQNR